MNKLLAIFATFFTFNLYAAAPVQFGRIVDIKGSGFISTDGRTHEIEKGEIIYTNSEIVIEHSGQVTFTDNADHRFYMGNSTSVAVYAKKVELRSGDLWVQSINKVDDYELTSANAKVNYQGGEAIFSYDSVKGKTQLMVINGLMKLSNLRAPELNLQVAEGNFSFVDQTFEEGMPRDPTPVGEKTFGKLVSLFPGVSTMDKQSINIFKENDHGPKKASREIASVHEEHGAAASAVIVEREEKAVHEVTAPVKKVVKAVHKTSTPKVSATPMVKIYGLAGSETSATTAIYDIPSPTPIAAANNGGNRMPASVPDAVPGMILDQAVPKAENMNTIPTTPQYKESDKLIEQLNKL